MKRNSCLIVLTSIWMTQSLLAQDPVKVLVETNSHRTPMIRGISSDGKYLEETVVSVQRNAPAELQFKYVGKADQLQGDFWEGATIRTVHDVEKGKIALILSQIVVDTLKEKPFAKKLQAGFERKLYPDVEEDNIVRFPTVSEGSTTVGGNGRITNTWLGTSGLLYVVGFNETTKHDRLGSIDLESKKMVDLEIENFYRPVSAGTLGEYFLSDGKSFFDRGSVRVIRFTKNGTNRTDLYLRLGREYAKSITLGMDEKTLLAAYEEGFVVWDISGQKQLKTSAFNPQLYSKNVGGRETAMLSDDLAIVVTEDYPRGSKAFLVDLNSGDILDVLVMDGKIRPTIGGTGYLRLAAAREYICFRADVMGEQTENMRQAFCLKIEGKKLVGPWQIMDPQNELPLVQVKNIVAATKAPILALETYTNVGSGEKQRILIADLDKLTSKPAASLRSAR